MNYDEFRTELELLLNNKQSFKTLEQDKEFDAIYTVPKVLITPTTGKERPINISEFWKIWNIAKTLPKHERFHPKHYTLDTMNSSYILALFKHVLKDQDME